MFLVPYRTNSVVNLDHLNKEYKRHRNYINTQTDLLADFQLKIKKVLVEKKYLFDSILGDCLLLLLLASVLSVFSPFFFLLGVVLVVFRWAYGTKKIVELDEKEERLRNHSEAIYDARERTIDQLMSVLDAVSQAHRDGF